MTLTELMKRMEELVETNEKLTAMLEDELGMAECAKLAPEQMSNYIENVTKEVPRRRVQTKVRKTLYESDIVRIKQLLGLGYTVPHTARNTGFSERTVRYVKCGARNYVLEGRV